MRIGCVSKQIEYLAASAILVFSLTDVRAQTPEPAKTDTYLPAYVRPPPRENQQKTGDEPVKHKKEQLLATAKQRRLKLETRAATNSGLRSRAQLFSEPLLSTRR
jgi:hypothetical protein